jgi:hypothetical protein
MENGEIILYTAGDGSTIIRLRAEEGTVRLTQLEMAELFQTTKQNISLHIRNILAEGELDEYRVVKEHLTTASDRKKIHH